MPLLGVDTYTFHRRFGVERTTHRPPLTTWTVSELVQALAALGPDIVSYQTMFLPDSSSAACAVAVEAIRTGPAAMFSWGGDLGLDGGRRSDRLNDLAAWCRHSEIVGANLMRIVVGGPRTRLETSFDQRLDLLAPLLREAGTIAETYGVTLAIETHADNTVTELLEIIEVTGHPGMGVVLDVANAVRVQDDPLLAADAFGGSLRMLHIRDLPLRVLRDEATAGEPCVPPGYGSIPLKELLDQLRVATFRGILALEYVALTEDWPDEVEATRAGMAWLRSTTTEWSTA